MICITVMLLLFRYTIFSPLPLYLTDAHTLSTFLSLNRCCFVSLTSRSISLQLSHAISVPLSLNFLYLYAPSYSDPILILFLFFNYLLLSLPFLTLSTISKVASFSKSSLTTFILPLLAALCKAVQPF